MHQLLTLLITLSLLAPTFAQTKQKYTLANGSTENLTLLYYNPGTHQVTYADTADIIQQKPLTAFAPTHHKAIKERSATKENTDFALYRRRSSRETSDSTNTYPPKPPLGWQLVGWNKGNRNSIMSFNQTDYGHKAGSCVPNSFINTLEWWDDIKIIEIPQQRTREKQIDWLHSKLSRASGTRNRGTDWDDLKKGVNKFAKEELGGKYHFHCIDLSYRNLDELVNYTRGNAAVCLSPTIYYGRKNGGGHGITLVRAKPNGELQLNTWGLKLAAKLKDITDPKSPNQKRYELEITTHEDLLPRWFVNDEIRFIFESNPYPNIYIFLPYQRQLPGTKYIPHPEPIQPPPPTKPTPSKLTQIAPTHFIPPPDFTSFKHRAKPLETTWTNTSRKSLTATLKSKTEDTITIRKGHKDYHIPKKSLIPQDILKAELWLADANSTVIPTSAATYLYTLAKDGTKITTVTIQTDGKNNAILTTSGKDDQYRYSKREFHLDFAQRRLAIYETKSNKLLAVHRTAGLTHQWSKRISRNKIPLTDWTYRASEKFPSRHCEINPISVREAAHLSIASRSTPILNTILATAFKSRPDIENQYHPPRKGNTWNCYSPHLQKLDSDLRELIEISGLLPTKIQCRYLDMRSQTDDPILTLTLEQILPAKPFTTKIPPIKTVSPKK